MPEVTRARVTQSTRTVVILPKTIVTSPFMVEPDLSLAELADPELEFTIEISTFNPLTRRTRGVISHHKGPPRGKSGKYGVGYRKIPPGCEVTATITFTKPRVSGGMLVERIG